MSSYARSNLKEAVAEAFSQYQAKRSGRYDGELEPGAKHLGEFLDRKDVRARLQRIARIDYGV